MCVWRPFPLLDVASLRKSICGRWTALSLKSRHAALEKPPLIVVVAVVGVRGKDVASGPEWDTHTGTPRVRAYILRRKTKRKQRERRNTSSDNSSLFMTSGIHPQCRPPLVLCYHTCGCPLFPSPRSPRGWEGIIEAVISPPWAPLLVSASSLMSRDDVTSNNVGRLLLRHTTTSKKWVW